MRPFSTEGHLAEGHLATDWPDWVWSDGRLLFKDLHIISTSSVFLKCTCNCNYIITWRNRRLLESRNSNIWLKYANEKMKICQFEAICRGVSSSGYSLVQSLHIFSSSSSSRSQLRGLAAPGRVSERRSRVRSQVASRNLPCPSRKRTIDIDDVIAKRTWRPPLVGTYSKGACVHRTEFLLNF